MLTLWPQDDWEIACDDDGGRLTRVAWRGQELLTPSPPTPLPVGERCRIWGEFETRPVFGYDDCWPSLEVSAWPGRAQTVRDHGELCWRKWELVAAEQGLVATACEPDDWRFTRQLSCRDKTLRFDFAATNDGPRPLTMGWAGHALLPPASVLNMSLPQCEAVSQAWPAAPLRDAPAYAEGVWPFLRELRGEAVMLVLEHCATPALALDLGTARWTITIEGVTRPSLGLWYNRDGYPPEPGLMREEFGVEWMLTAQCLLQDAATKGEALILAPGETFRWAVTWIIEELT